MTTISRQPVNFPVISTLAELDALDDDEIFAGYTEAKPTDPEPGENRGKAYWHGWCNRQRDAGVLDWNPIHADLVHQCRLREDALRPVKGHA
ncbi:hypothetical protein [Tardiphaga sp.]|jgi:hypothetical protein|uniref:hypothetical protein n=1 Tax=Tardiphaga sp. TaxID=1926292 RepID=UPI0037DA627E